MPVTEKTIEKENKPKSFNLRARIAELASDASHSAAARTLSGIQVSRMTKLDAYPCRLRGLREQINYLSEIQSELLKPYTAAINEIKADIAGDKAYSNEEKRRIELEARLADWTEYQNDLNEHAALTGAIKRLSLELDSTVDQFRAARLIYERETAQILAGAGKEK